MSMRGGRIPARCKARKRRRKAASASRLLKGRRFLRRPPFAFLTLCHGPIADRFRGLSMRHFSSIRPKAAVAAALLTLGACVTATAQQERAVPQSRAEQLLSFSPVVKRAQPAVVNV